MQMKTDIRLTKSNNCKDMQPIKRYAETGFFLSVPIAENQHHRSRQGQKQNNEMLMTNHMGI